MPRFSLRFNLSDPHQKTAWELLCAVPEGQRSAYVTELLYRSATQTDEDEHLRKIIREELARLELRPAEKKTAIPSQSLNFLASL